MTIISRLVTVFEDLSDETIISITEYLVLENFITSFANLNSRLTYLVFDHPWTFRQINIRTMDKIAIQKKIAFIDNMKLQSNISSIAIQPYSIYRSIDIFNQLSPIYNYVNLKTLSLNNITLDEVSSSI